MGSGVMRHAALRAAKTAALVALCAACRLTPPKAPGHPAPPRDPAADRAEAERLFHDLEERLQHAKHIDIKARLKSTRQLPAGFMGGVSINQRDPQLSPVDFI